jgi:hypothetical protein
MSTAYIAARLIGGRQGTINRIVIHGTSSACKLGGARGNASWFQNRAARGSAHYVVDPGEIVQCVPEDRVAAHAPPNTGSIGYELCDPNAGPPGRWYDANHVAMLKLAAPHVRDCARRHGIPLVWLSVADLKAGKRGITSHNNVTQAFHQSTHTDPVGFDAPYFMAMVTGPAHRWTTIFPGNDDRDRGGHDVAEVQMRLHALASMWKAPDVDPGPVDGIHGVKSCAAVMAFKRRIVALQKLSRQEPWPNTDAVVGPVTLDMLRWWTEPR